MGTWIDVETCLGCGLCNVLCPWEALKVSTEDFVNHVDEEKCVRCFICLNACPVEAIKVPPCRVACPIHMDIPGYLSLCSQGKVLEGYKLMRKTNALPAILGRVCYHPCQDACRSGYVDDPIAICDIKRFLADHVDLDKVERPKVKKLGKKIAVVGSGPAGLAAAHEFFLIGYDVTIFEADPEPGGMLRYGIPEYRLPKHIVSQDIGYIQSLEIEIKTNTKVGDKVKLEDLRHNFQAVFIATGANETLKLKITGVDTPGVISGIDLLRAVNTGQKVDIEKRKVLVIGGGNVAIDAARVALRKGATEAHIIYRRERKDMPAMVNEIKAAEEEGVHFHFLTAPTRILGHAGKVSGVSIRKAKATARDEEGGDNPLFADGEEKVMDADMVVVAIGQVPSLASFGIDLKINPRTLTTNLPGVYAGGDVVSGPSMVVKAMASGKSAARYIHRYLNSKPEYLELVRKHLEKLSQEEYRSRIRVQKTHPAAEVPAEVRVKDFREIGRTYTQRGAQTESRRCVRRRVCSEYYDET